VPVRRVRRSELDALAGKVEHRGAGLLLAGELGAAQPAAGGAKAAADGPAGEGAASLRERLASISSPTALILLLDEINDPRNLGAILRSADQFGVELVILPTRRAARQTQAVVLSSAGASLYVPLHSLPSLASGLESVKEAGFWVYGADLGGRRLDTVRFEGRVALVLGSEGSGLRRLVRERCDLLVRIPSGGRVDSLNVSVAAGILMHEIRRQQSFPGFP
jgi:23S rRNA (guanosine2251-2'-O)-methyltransferase